MGDPTFRRAWPLLILFAFGPGGCATAVSSSPAPSLPDLPLSAIGSIARLIEIEDRLDFRPEVIGAAATSDIAEVRLRAALAAGRIGDPGAVPIIQPLLADQDSAVAASAAFALGLLGQPAAVDLLLPLIAPPSDTLRPTVAAESFRALGRIADPRGLGAIRAYLLGADTALHAARPEVTVAALEAAASAHSLTATVATRWLSSGSPAVRHAAARSIAQFNEGESARLLFPLIDDASPEVRLSAVRSLAAGSVAETDLDVEQVVAALITRLDDESPSVAFEASRLLPSYRTPPAQAALLEVVDSASSSRILAVLQGIAEYGATPSWDRRLLQIATDTGAPSALRATAIQGLTSAAITPGLFETLIADRSWRVRAALAGRYVAEGLLPSEQILALVMDADDRVALAAAEPLFLDSDAPYLADFAWRVAHAQDAHLRALALRWIGREGKPASLPILLDAYSVATNDPENAAALAAIDALATLGASSRGRPERALVARHREAPDYLIRRRANRAFGPDVMRRWGAAEPVSTGTLPAVYRQHALRWIGPASSRTFRPHLKFTTTVGEFEVELLSDLVPTTVANFLRLVRADYFDGQEISAVAPGRWLSTGSRRGDSIGGPGYSIRDEENRVPFHTGLMVMLTDEPDAAGSRFEILLEYGSGSGGTGFGQVTSGMDVLRTILPGDRILDVMEVVE